MFSPTALMILYSLSMACAVLLMRVPGGFLRMTYFVPLASVRK